MPGEPPYNQGICNRGPSGSGKVSRAAWARAGSSSSRVQRAAAGGGVSISRPNSAWYRLYQVSRGGADHDYQPFKVNVRPRSTAVITAAA